MEKQKCIVKYQISSYSGKEIVYCDKNDDDKIIFDKCKQQLSKNTPLPYGMQSFKIIKREYCFND